MQGSVKIFFLLSITAVILNFISCESINREETKLFETMEPIEEVSEIPGAEKATITVNLNQQSYFRLEFSDINTNDVFNNGTREGWCIDWTKRIDSNNNTYNGVKLYSSRLVEKWKPLNYLLNVKDELLRSDSEISWREIQLAIWSLRANPSFDLDTVPLDELPSEMRSNGKPTFNYDKVREILDTVEKEYRNFDFSKGRKFAVVVETPADVQTVIAVAEREE